MPGTSATFKRVYPNEIVAAFTTIKYKKLFLNLKIKYNKEVGKKRELFVEDKI